MNLICCDGCGVILNKDKLVFPDAIYDDDYSIDLTKAVWDSDARDYVPFVSCPVCTKPVMGK